MGQKLGDVVHVTAMTAEEALNLQRERNQEREGEGGGGETGVRASKHVHSSRLMMMIADLKLLWSGALGEIVVPGHRAEGSQAIPGSASKGCRDTEHERCAGHPCRCIQQNYKII